MLCTFTTEHGNLVIVSDDIKGIEDTDRGCYLTWLVAGDVHCKMVQGTAAENRDRIQQEELDLITRVNQHQQNAQRRIAAGQPPVSVIRGRK